MRATQVLMTLLTAGALTLGAGVTLAATGESKAPEPARTPAVSRAPALPQEQEAKETGAVQKAEKARAAAEKGEKEVAPDRIVRGDVTAVEVSAKTLTVRAGRGKRAETIGVEVPDTAKITRGKAVKTLADIKVGDRVRMKYDRMSDRLVADQIRILNPTQTAARHKSS